MPKILVIEDTENNRIIIGRRLKSKGHEVHLREDAESGISAAKEIQPVLILMDIGLPGMDGWTAARALKADPETADIPIIALTAHAMAGDREKSIEAGCSDYETKPIDFESLFHKIEVLIRPLSPTPPTFPEASATPPDSKPATPASPHINAPGVSLTRHNLRNPLGEIQGFADILTEEARELGHQALVTELKALSDATGTILKQVNQTLTVEHLAAHPGASDDLGCALQLFSQKVAESAAALRNRCSRMEGQPFLEDLARIRISAQRLGERTPELLAEMFEPGGTTFTELEQSTTNPAGKGKTVFFRKPSPTVTVAAGSEDTTFLIRSEIPSTVTGTILVVDDTESNRALLTRRLSREGFTVALAENGRRALDLLGRYSFDLVLLDIMMPEMDGHQVLTAMKADLNLRHIPVIMISGLDDLETLVRCIEGGAEDYLTKPFDPVFLRARIGACLDKKRLRDRERKYLSEIEEQRRRADELLHVILPHAIAEELKTTRAVRPQRHENVAVLFSDIAGFTAFCDQNPPELVMDHLQNLVRECEDIAARHGLEKIKTIGDSFMAAGGLIDPLENPALSCVRAALEMTRAAEAMPCKWTMHVGIHIGPVVAGVVGRRKYMYDIWGDTVNTAARVAGAAASGRLHVSADVWARIAPHVQGSSIGLHPLKGKGDLELFNIEALRS